MKIVDGECSRVKTCKYIKACMFTMAMVDPRFLVEIPDFGSNDPRFWVLGVGNSGTGSDPHNVGDPQNVGF